MPTLCFDVNLGPGLLVSCDELAVLRALYRSIEELYLEPCASKNSANGHFITCSLERLAVTEPPFQRLRQSISWSQ